MKLVIDGFSRLFTVPLGAQFGRIWKILLNYLSEHNRTIVSAKLFKDAEANAIMLNNTVVADFEKTTTTEFFKLEITSIPKKYANIHLQKSAQNLIEKIDNEVFTPLVRLLEDETENRTDKIKTAILTNSKEQVQIFNEFISVLFFLSKTDVAKELANNVEQTENIYARIMNAIEHNDMSTLIHLVSVEMEQYFVDIKRKLRELSTVIHS